MKPDIVLGSIVIAKRDTPVSGKGEVGVCYRIGTLARQPRYRFIFERGRYGGFSPDDVALFLEVTGRTCEAVANYAFRNARQLEQDFRAGRFAVAFFRTATA